MAGSPTRGALLGTGASAIGGAKLTRGWSAAAVPAPVITITPGAFDARFDGDLFAVQLDGAPTGWIAPPQGGEPSADVVTEKLGSDNVQRKHIGNLKYNEFTLSASVGMSKGLYDWIKSSFDRSYARKNGSVVAADFNFKAVASATFTDALITEITIPELDAGAKDPAYVTVSVAPTSTQFVPTSGQPAGNPPPKPLPASFKLAIDGLDTSRVSKIESFTVKQSIDSASDGTLSVDLDIPNLAFWVDSDASATWSAWEDDFLLKGNNGQDKERSGSLSFLDQKGVELFTLSLANLGVFKGTPEALENSKDAIRRVKFEMYCENITMKYGDGAWA